MPGAAFLLLRISVAAHAIIICALPQISNGLPVWARALVIVASLILALGYLSPLASLLCVCTGMYFSLYEGMLPNVDEAFALIDGLVVTMVGPGAYSVDAFLFGRHVTVLTNRARDDE